MAEMGRSLVGLLADARVEDLEHWREDVLATLPRVDAKRGRLQGQIAAASRGRRRRVAPLPAADDHDGGACGYTRKGAAGASRRKLRAAAGDAKKERERLEALLGDLEVAIVDARERVALQPAGRTA